MLTLPTRITFKRFCPSPYGIICHRFFHDRTLASESQRLKLLSRQITFCYFKISISTFIYILWLYPSNWMTMTFSKTILNSNDFIFLIYVFTNENIKYQTIDVWLVHLSLCIWYLIAFDCTNVSRLEIKATCSERTYVYFIGNKFQGNRIRRSFDDLLPREKQVSSNIWVYVS